MASATGLAWGGLLTRRIPPPPGGSQSAPHVVAYPGPMAIAAVSLSPLGVGISVSKYVAVAIEVLEAQDDVRWELDSMFTTLEGEPDVLFEVIRKMQEAIFAAGAERVGTVIKMDDRRDQDGVTMEGKVASVRAKLGSS